MATNWYMGYAGVEYPIEVEGKAPRVITKKRRTSKRLTKAQKIKAMMDFYGYSYSEAKAALEDMGE